ncbi:glycosyltransferase family 2 protein [Mongoliitalea daihaiensis]|uniref:glycosyltransferase family 2 protein n=1 Tax=Mongoliitalea daihaiensis TaxID=2782006 RepID=UPI001F2814C0|nr:glycosyltransferase family 2 protein [Mongoliitalea daihaiensis]UJP66656.1 glycosyltransferase family 2 protein [Mongoliitalea daihaiensis]
MGSTINSSSNKKIAVITMARNDDFFLTRWIAYYGKELGEEHCYIYLDGEDQPVPANRGKVNVFHEKRVAEHVVKAEKRRLGFLSTIAKSLLETYDMVIGVDADEYLVVDPSIGKSLVAYLSEIPIDPCVSGLGIDVGQDRNSEPILDRSLPFLGQRSYALLSSRYTKPSVISKPVNWGSGFHRVKGHNFRIDPNLYLFHFGSVDYDMILDRFKDKDRMATGRAGHIKKRARTIDIITNSKPKVDEKWLRLARTLQTFARPIWAWNKPTMLKWKLVVRIPDRFKGIV